MRNQKKFKQNNTENYDLIKAVSKVADIFEYSESNRAAFKKSQSVLRKINNIGNNQINEVFDDLRYQVRLGAANKDTFGGRVEGYGIVEIYRMHNLIDVYVFDSAYGKFLDWDQKKVNKYCANNIRFLKRVLNQLPV